MSLNSRQEIERQEREKLAGYAALAAESRGREYPLEEHPLRTAFQRDRDRVIHSAAFRRMEYKTQVFLPHEADHFRTRLTHSIEVAQISRSLARNLKLNEDLTEAIALVHDLGHTPFGHSGEDVLAELLKDHGGFNHNRQSLRIVDLLEQRYPEHPGLNLSFEVREGIAKHETRTTTTNPEFDHHPWPTMEALLVDTADEIAYNAHDIDDGLNSGLISLEDIEPLAVWKPVGSFEGFSFSDSQFLNLDDDQKRRQLVRYLINCVATDLLSETQLRINSLSISDVDSVRRAPKRVCGYSEKIAARVTELKSVLFVKLYRHPRLQEHSDRARLILTSLFQRLTENTGLLPLRFREMLQTEDRPIVVADYIAGMTDRFAERLFQEIGERSS
ncbi:MAG: deoxyguanosinetriphosphate triphosphohydrolase [bacterium]|nr:deoxyguanosinetriphosphate triphosphohydrolase [bacterium]